MSDSVTDPVPHPDSASAADWLATLPPLVSGYANDIGPDKLAGANQVRLNIAYWLPRVVAGWTAPKLTVDEIVKVLEKVRYLIRHETRASYFLSAVPHLAELRPGTAEEPTELPPLIVKSWLNRSGDKGKGRGAGANPPQTRLKGALANGRVIRDAKGL